MPSHMSSIGFPVGTPQDFAFLATQAVQRGQRIEAPGAGSYRLWSPGEGIELWAQIDQRGKPIGLNPHFSGQARMQVRLERLINRPRDSALDGAFYGWADPSDSNSQYGAYPFAFNSPDYRVHANMSLPRVVSVQLAAFAHDLQAFDNEQEIRSSEGQMSKMSIESCIPSGTFTPEGKPIDPPKSEVIFCGTVLETARLTNPFTQHSFYWSSVRTFGGELEVVADPAIIKGTITKNGIVGGSCWLSGWLK